MVPTIGVYGGLRGVLVPNIGVEGSVGAFMGTPAEVALIRMTADGR